MMRHRQWSNEQGATSDSNIATGLQDGTGTGTGTGRGRDTDREAKAEQGVAAEH